MDYFSFLLAALLSLAIGRVSPMSDNCQKLGLCSSSHDPMTMTGRTERECQEMKKVVSCYDKYVDLCDIPFKVERVRHSNGILKQRLAASCVTNKDRGLISPDSASCHHLVQCVAMTSGPTMKDHQDDMCRSLEKAVGCFDLYLPRCDNQAIVAGFRGTIDQLRHKLMTTCDKDHKKAVPVARYSFMRAPPSECDKQFRACLTPEFLHASEHKNYTRLCNAAAGVFPCLERVLEDRVCQSVRDKDRSELRTHIDILRGDIDPGCIDTAWPSSSVSVFLLLVCMALTQLHICG
ncbi:hypothetical protein EGW08_012011 [Elysia chlorotica]|uniref:DUF19 domain-containing protein n=1 Tax=Elysia chlorotica TaxID=188477 RepID=A0A3S0ZQ51_ELYCH|nr:hypothetical protein EGW08_012011 [Elysia chlorotica]